jgi:hypothetical protein
MLSCGWGGKTYTYPLLNLCTDNTNRKKKCRILKCAWDWSVGEFWNNVHFIWFSIVMLPSPPHKGTQLSMCMFNTSLQTIHVHFVTQDQQMILWTCQMIYLTQVDYQREGSMGKSVLGHTRVFVKWLCFEQCLHGSSKYLDKSVAFCLHVCWSVMERSRL